MRPCGHGERRHSSVGVASLLSRWRGTGQGDDERYGGEDVADRACGASVRRRLFGRAISGGASRVFLSQACFAGYEGWTLDYVQERGERGVEGMEGSHRALPKTASLGLFVTTFLRMTAFI